MNRKMALLGTCLAIAGLSSYAHAVSPAEIAKFCIEGSWKDKFDGRMWMVWAEGSAVQALQDSSRITPGLKLLGKKLNFAFVGHATDETPLFVRGLAPSSEMLAHTGYDPEIYSIGNRMEFVAPRKATVAEQQYIETTPSLFSLNEFNRPELSLHGADLLTKRTESGSGVIRRAEKAFFKSLEDAGYSKSFAYTDMPTTFEKIGSDYYILSRFGVNNIKEIDAAVIGEAITDALQAVK